MLHFNIHNNFGNVTPIRFLWECLFKNEIIKMLHSKKLYVLIAFVIFMISAICYMTYMNKGHIISLLMVNGVSAVYLLVAYFIGRRLFKNMKLYLKLRKYIKNRTF